MHSKLIRATAIFLLPCLMIDPVNASAMRPSPPLAAAPLSSDITFDSQAFALILMGGLFVNMMDGHRRPEFTQTVGFFHEQVLRGSKRRKTETGVAGTTDLRFKGRPDLKLYWKKLVNQHVEMDRFAKGLATLTRKHGFLWRMPVSEVDALLYQLDFSGSMNRLKYMVSFITLNAGCDDNYDQQTQYRLNLLLLLAMARSANRPAATFYGNHNWISSDKAQVLARYYSPYTQKDPALTRDTLPHLPHFLAAIPLTPGETQLFTVEFMSMYVDIFASPRPRPAFHLLNPGEIPKSAYVAVSPEYKALLPGAFQASPSHFVESLHDMLAPSPEYGFGELIAQIDRLQYTSPTLPLADAGKVKRMPLSNGTFLIVKRVDPLRVRYPEEEIRGAQNMHSKLQAVNSRYRAERFVGITYDWGAFYLLSEEISYEFTGYNIPDGVDPDERRDIELNLEMIQGVLNAEGLPDSHGGVRLKDILVGAPTEGERVYTVVDFESLAYQYRWRSGRPVIFRPKKYVQAGGRPQRAAPGKDETRSRQTESHWGAQVGRADPLLKPWKSRYSIRDVPLVTTWLTAVLLVGGAAGLGAVAPGDWGTEKVIVEPVRWGWGPALALGIAPLFLAAMPRWSPRAISPHRTLKFAA